MSINIFGKIDSPCIANWAAKKTAKDQTKSYSKRAIESILEHFYTNDFLDKVNQKLKMYVKKYPKFCKRVDFI